MGNKHFENLRCPKCGKGFETRQGLKAHQGAKRHTTEAIHNRGDYVDRLRAAKEHRRHLKNGSPSNDMAGGNHDSA